MFEMSGQQEPSANIKVVEFTIIAAPETAQQYARPYVLSADANSISNLADAVDGVISSGGSLMPHINQDGWMSVSSQPTHVVNIPGGWDLQRGTFRLVLDVTIPTGSYRYEIEGYTEYLDTKSSYIDTEMRLYIDHVISFMLHGNTTVVDDVNFLHSPVNLPDNIQGMGHTARVSDLNSSLTVKNDLNIDSNKGWADPEVDLIDTRPGIYNSVVQVSTPTDLVISMYLKNLVGSWIDEGSKATFDPWGKDSVFDDAAQVLIAPAPSMIAGVKATGATESIGPSNCITLGELITNLNIDVNQITMVTAPPQDVRPNAFAGISMPLGYAGDWHVGSAQSVHWTDSDIVTTTAYSIINQVQPVLLRHGLVQAEIAAYIYSGMDDARDVLVSNIVPATSHINPGAAANALKMYILNQILVPISQNGRLAIQFTASVYSYGDARMSITISDGERTYGPYEYSIPTYASAALSPVVMPDTDAYNSIVDTAARMQNVVKDVVGHAATQPIHTL